MKNQDKQQLHDTIVRGVLEGVAKAQLEHKRLNVPIVISKDGIIVEIAPEDINVDWFCKKNSNNDDD